MKYEIEYGSSQQFRVLNFENSRMYDSEGKVVLCKCGKPVGSAAIGKEAFVAWCEDCSPTPKYDPKFVYKVSDALKNLE